MSNACEDDGARLGPSDAGGSRRRTRILAGAIECFAQLGIERTSINDVAESAGVSRGTVYRYFTDRDGLVSAAIDFGAKDFYRQLAESMAAHATLNKQLGAMAEAFARILVDHRTRSRLMNGDAELIHHMICDGGTAVDRISAFLSPYVHDAHRRGELRQAIDCESASEWLARIIFSLATIGPARSFDVAEPASVRRHLEEFGISGLR